MEGKREKQGVISIFSPLFLIPQVNNSKALCSQLFQLSRKGGFTETLEIQDSLFHTTRGDREQQGLGELSGSRKRVHEDRGIWNGVEEIPEMRIQHFHGQLSGNVSPIYRRGQCQV